MSREISPLRLGAETFLCLGIQPNCLNVHFLAMREWSSLGRVAYFFPACPIKGNVKRNISPSARCRNFFVSRHSAQLFERALSRDARVVFLRPSRLFRSGV